MDLVSARDFAWKFVWKTDSGRLDGGGAAQSGRRPKSEDSAPNPAEKHSNINVKDAEAAEEPKELNAAPELFAKRSMYSADLRHLRFSTTSLTATKLVNANLLGARFMFVTIPASKQTFIDFNNDEEPTEFPVFSSNAIFSPDTRYLAYYIEADVFLVERASKKVCRRSAYGSYYSSSSDRTFKLAAASPITTLKFSVASDMLLGLNKDQGIHGWDKTGEVFYYQHPPGAICDFAGCGSLLAISLNTGGVHVWECSERVYMTPSLLPAIGPAKVEFSITGRFLAAFGYVTLAIFIRERNTFQLHFEQRLYGLQQMLFSCDENYFVCSHNEAVKLYDLRHTTFRQITFPNMCSLVWYPYPDLLGVKYLHSIKVWSLNELMHKVIDNVPIYQLKAVGYSNSTGLIGLYWRNSSVWMISTRQQRRKLCLENVNGSLHLSEDCQWFALCQRRDLRGVILVNTQTLASQKFDTADKTIDSVSFCLQEGILVTRCLSNYLEFWDMHSGQRLRLNTQFCSPQHFPVGMTDSKEVMVACIEANSARIEPLSQVDVSMDLSLMLNHVAVASSQQYAAWVRNYQQLHVYNIVERLIWNRWCEAITSLNFSACNRTLVVGTDRDILCIPVKKVFTR